MRKSCASQPNPGIAYVNDILDTFEKAENNDIELPTFAAGL